MLGRLPWTVRGKLLHGHPLASGLAVWHQPRFSLEKRWLGERQYGYCVVRLSWPSLTGPVCRAPVCELAQYVSWPSV